MNSEESEGGKIHSEEINSINLYNEQYYAVYYNDFFFFKTRYINFFFDAFLDKLVVHYKKIDACPNLETLS